MLKANLWNKSVPKVELDQRARDGRLQVEQIERLLVIPRAAVMHSRLRRLLFLLSLRTYGGEPLQRRVSDRRPSRMLNFLRSGAWRGFYPRRSTDNPCAPRSLNSQTGTAGAKDA